MSVEKHDGFELRKAGLSFTSLPNEVAEKIKRPEALAIWFYVYSKPDTWVIRPADIMARFDIGRERYWAAMRELRDLGVVWDFEERDGAGRLVTRKIVCSNIPMQVLERMGLEPQLRETALEDQSSTTGNPQVRLTVATVGDTPYKEKKDLYKEKTTYKEKSSNSNKQQLDDWNLTAEVIRDLEMLYGIPIDFVDQHVAQFKRYWRDRQEIVVSWDAKFMDSCANRWRKHTMASRA